MATKHQWLEILSNPIFSEIIAHSALGVPASQYKRWKEILVSPFYSESVGKCFVDLPSYIALSCACKSLAATYHKPGLYVSPAYQRCVQLAPFTYRPICLGKYRSFSASGQQSVRILDEARLLYCNGRSTVLRVCAPNHELADCVISRQVGVVQGALDRGNFVAFIEHELRHQDSIRVLMPTAHGTSEQLEVPLPRHSRYLAKQISIFDLPEGSYLLVHYMHPRKDLEHVLFVALGQGLGEPKEMRIKPSMQIRQIIAVCLHGRQVFAFLLSDTTDETTSTPPKMIRMYHPAHGDEKCIDVGPYTSSMVNISRQFVVLLALNTASAYEIQALDTETNQLGPVHALPNMFYSPEMVDGELRGGHVTIQAHLPFDNSPLGRQLIACSGFEACTYLSRGLHFHSLRRFALGIDRHVTDFSVTHWRGEDGRMRVRFYLGDIHGDIHECSPGEVE